MNKVVKITRQQFNEAEGDDMFQYLDWNDGDRPFSAQSEISADGKMNSGGNGDPLTTDKVAAMVTPQSALRYKGFFGRQRGIMSMREDNDRNGDGVDDFYNDKELDTLSDGNKDNDTTRVPSSVLKKLDMLIDAIAMAALKPKQVAMVMNKVIENMNFETVPFSWRKELSMKILNNRPDKQQAVK